MEQSLQALAPITLQQMIIFIQVVESNGFAKASSILHMTQSAVSKSIAKLEKELDITLFTRTTREIHLTEAGKHLYEEWKVHIRSIHNSYSKALDIHQKGTAVIRIGLLNTARPDRYFWNIQKEFMEKNPGVTIELQSEYMTDLIQKLSLNVYDIVMVPDFERFALDDYQLSWKWAAKNNARIFVSEQSPFANKEYVYMKDILNATFISLGKKQSSNYAKDLNERFAAYKKTPSVEAEFDNAYSIQYLFNPQKNVLFADNFFDYPDFLNLTSIPVKDQYNGIICGYNPNSNNPHVKAFLHSLPVY